MNITQYDNLSKLLPILLLCLLVHSNADADWRGKIRDGRDIFVSDLKASGETVSAYFLAPVFWDSSDWWLVGGAAGMSGAAMSFDRSVRTEVQASRGDGNYWLMRFGRRAGDKTSAVGLASGFYVVGLIGGNHKIRTTGRLLFEGYFTAGATTTFLKTVTGRHRPYTNDGPFVFTPLGWENYLRAFPSGHSTIGWVTAGVLAKQTESTFVDVLLYSSATIISASRIYHDKHWLSDVIFGGFVGYTAADFVVRKERKRRNTGSIKQSNLSIILTPHPGFAIQWWFD